MPRNSSRLSWYHCLRRLKAIGFLLVIVGIIIIFMSTVLTLVKLPQTFVKKGPDVKLNENITYWIDTWILPPIDAGTPFSLELEGAQPGGLTIAILPSRDGEVIPGSSPLLTDLLDRTQKRLSISTTAPISSEYTVFIVSIRNNFTLRINSNWSPFYNLRVNLYFGVGVLLTGLLVIYYDRINEGQKRIIREALKGH